MTLIPFAKSLFLLLFLALVPECLCSKRQVQYGEKASFTINCVRDCTMNYEEYLAEGNKPDAVGQCNINLDLGKGEWDGEQYSEGSDKTTPPPGYLNFPAVLRGLNWDCKALCDYSCHHSHSQRSSAEGKFPTKYKSRWAFVRILGIEEFASFLACVLNGIIHLYHLASNKNRHLYAGPEGYRMKAPMLLYSVVCINSFFWSSLFFVSKTKQTEKMDQYFAFLMVIFTFWIAVYRIGGSGAGENLFGNICAYTSLAILAPCLFLFAAYIYYMTNFMFNPLLSMRLKVVFNGLHAIIWIYWSLLGRGWGKGYRWKCLVCVISTNIITIVELALPGWEMLDFVPYFGIFGNESIYLLYTVPFTALWYSFLGSDTKWEVDAMDKKKK